LSRRIRALEPPSYSNPIPELEPLSRNSRVELPLLAAFDNVKPGKVFTLIDSTTNRLIGVELPMPTLPVLPMIVRAGRVVVAVPSAVVVAK
jgi:hypothetical protein